MLLDQALSVMERVVAEIKTAPPEKRDHFLKMSLSFFDMATSSLETSIEFRQAFAKVHGEFLNHPECRETIKKSLEAYQKYYSES